jgi:hypothetical protein
MTKPFDWTALLQQQIAHGPVPTRAPLIVPKPVTKQEVKALIYQVRRMRIPQLIHKE